MIAFHGRQDIKEKYLTRVRAHRAADELVRGQYWNKDQDGIFRGCAVGCTLHSGRHEDYEAELGIPRLLARLEDGIFEGLDSDRAMAWPEEFLSAIPAGAELSMVWPQFAVWLLIDDEHGVLRYAKNDKAKAVIVEVADVYSRIVAGQIVPADERRKIYKNADAYAAADAYAYAAAYAAAVAAAAYAAYAYADADAYAYADAAADADAYAYADAAAVAADAYADAYAAAVAADAAVAAYADADAYAYAYAARTKARAAQADKLLELMSAAPVIAGEAVSA